LITKTEANMRRCRFCSADVSIDPWQQLSLINSFYVQGVWVAR
jgi:hypothetical protein